MWLPTDLNHRVVNLFACSRTFGSLDSFTPKSWHSTPEHLKLVLLRTSTLAGLRGTSFSGQVGSAARSEPIGHMLHTKRKTAKVEHRPHITNPSGGRTTRLSCRGPRQGR